MTKEKLLGPNTFLANIDDSNLDAEVAQSRALADSLGLEKCCLKMAEFGLNQQQAWQWAKSHFEQVSFREFKSLFDSASSRITEE